MKHQSKLSQEQQFLAEHSAQELHKQTGHEFANADEALRFDARQTAVPRQIEQRLKQSAADIAPPRRSWWRNLLGH